MCFKDQDCGLDHLRVGEGDVRFREGCWERRRRLLWSRIRQLRGSGTWNAHEGDGMGGAGG